MSKLSSSPGSFLDFAARPMLSLAFGLDDAGFARFIEERKRDLPQYIRNAIRP